MFQPCLRAPQCREKGVISRPAGWYCAAHAPPEFPKHPPPRRPPIRLADPPRVRALKAVPMAPDEVQKYDHEYLRRVQRGLPTDFVPQADDAALLRHLGELATV